MNAPFVKSFDKVVLITGGSKGIGAGCARVFVEAGARVHCARGRETGSAGRRVDGGGAGQCHFLRAT